MFAINYCAAHRPLLRGWSGYLIAHSAKSLLWHSSGLLFAFFLTETCGFLPRAMGAIIAASLLVNAAADAGLGATWQRCDRMPGKLARSQAIGAALAALFFVGFCALPFVAAGTQLPMAAMLLIAFRLSFAMLDVSQNAMVAIIARDASARTALLAARNVCSGMASLAVVLLAVPMLLSGTDRALRHLCWAGAAGCAVALSAIVFARSQEWPRAVPAVSSLDTDRPVQLHILLAITGVVVAASTLFRSLEPYAAAFAGFGSGILLWASIGAIACQPFWFFAGFRLSPARAAALAGWFTLVAAAALGASPIPRPLSNMLGGLGFGIGSGGLWLMLWSVAVRTDAVRRTARLSAVSKAAQAVAALALGQMLHGTGYRLATTSPSSLPRSAMIGALLVIASCGFALAVREWRISRTARGEVSGMRRPTALPDPAPVPRPLASSSAHARRVVPAE